MGANPNATDNRGYTPLHVSVYARNEESTMLLLQCGAPPNSYGSHPDFYQTPFHRARSEGVVKALLHNGGYPFAIAEDTYAGAIRYQSVLRVLLKKQQQAAAELFEHGISTNEQPIDAPDFLVIFDYELFYQEGLVSTANGNGTKEMHNHNLTPTAAVQHCDEMAAHRAILKYNTSDILKHPLSESYLHIKWQMAKNILYTNLIYFLLFVISLTSLAFYEADLLKCDVKSFNETGNITFSNLKYLVCSAHISM